MISASDKISEEKWLPVVGYEGLYEVSDRGKIRSIRGSMSRMRGSSMRFNESNGRYANVQLCKSGSVKTFRVHRLVAMSFIPNPYNLPEVNHINENGLDNRVENLEWCTRIYNNNFGTRNKKCSDRFSIKVVMIQNNGEEAEFHSMHSAAEWLRLNGYPKASPSVVCRCCKSQGKDYHGLKFRYKQEF